MNPWHNPRQDRGAESTRRVRKSQPLRMEPLESRELLSVNEIVLENQLPGNPSSEWDIVGVGTGNIEGFATDISVDQGQTVQFKVNTNSTDYRLDIYRMGYYGGLGARKVATVQPSLVPFDQPSPTADPTTGLVDAGNWSVTASWSVPTNATSGIYFAKLVREDGIEGNAHIVFVVRDDDGNSELLFQTSDTTWQAYNNWGGKSLYDVTSGGQRAYKVSYNRPFDTRGIPGGMGETNWVFWAEYPMVRWLERNGYDVSYFTNVDADRIGAEILEHQSFLSVGHDEYWSAGQRDNVETARDAGVHLAFFSGNEVYWKTRWEPSIDGTNTDYRTLVTYKESPLQKLDPLPNVWTGQWADDSFSPPADGGRPQNELTGQLFTVNRGPGGEFGTPIQVPAEFANMRFWRDTSVANLQPGQVAFLANGTLGYEWDEDVDNGYRPPGQFRMSSTTEFVPEKVLQTTGGCVFGGTGLCGSCGCGPVEPGWATHSLVMYRTPAGAIVFGAGTVQWSFGLDGNHDGQLSVEDPRMQQATVNLFADMGVQPGTLQGNLVPATQSTDHTAPTPVITSPSSNLMMQSDTTQVQITGTAVDAGGGVVAGVEVSVDGGTRWHPVTGRNTWSYTWTPEGSGSAQIMVRAADDSGNLSAPVGGITVTILPDETTAPAISGVTAAGVDSESVEIRWTTDEAATSEVHYGLTPGALNTIRNSSSLVKSHSLTLLGLSPNTKYHYRVVSVDEFSNATTSPAAPSAPLEFSTPAFIDTTSADFAAGTVSGLAVQSVNGDSLFLQPAAAADFASSIPAGWTATPWQAGGGVTVSGGQASVDGAMLATNALFSPQRTLEFSASFSGATFQHVGFANDFAQPHWAMFSTGSNGAMSARSASGGQSFETPLTQVALGQLHDFRIEITANNVTYWVNGVQVAQHAISIVGALRPVASDASPGGGGIQVDWMRMSPYAASGSIESRVFDAGAAVHWDRIQWGSQAPAGTSVQLSVRMGNTPTPGASWTSFTPIASSGQGTGGVARYIQYRAVLTGNTAATPLLESVSLSHSPAATDATAPAVSEFAPAGADVAPDAPVTASFNELMNAATLTTATFRLQRVGSGVDLAAQVTVSGSTVTLSPDQALLPEADYQVILSGSASDLNGNALGADVTWNFTTGWQALVQSTGADFLAGTVLGGASIAETLDGELALAPAAGAEFFGPGIPADWTSTAWQGGGSATVANGNLRVDAAMAGASALFGTGRSLEFVATFSGDAWQHLGWGVDLAGGSPFAMFSTRDGGALYARTPGLADVALGAGWLGAPHRYRIDRTATELVYSIDGVQVASHAAAIGANMRALASDFLIGGQDLAVDWMRTGPYAATGVYESAVLDPGQAVYWDAVLWDDYVPSGGNIELSVRIGDSPTPDASWTEFLPLSSSGALIGGAARYTQYQVELSRNGVTLTDGSPQLRNIRLNYSPVVDDTTPPAVIAVTPAPGAIQVDAQGDVTVSLNDLIDPSSVTSGAFQLVDTLTSQIVPASLHVSGSQLILQPHSPLEANREYQATLSTAVTDRSGNAIPAAYQWSFTTDYLRVGDDTSADFAAGATSGTAVSTADDGAVTLAASVVGNFAGPGVPSGWFATAWNAGGGVQFAGAATVDGAWTGTNAVHGPGRTLEFSANFSGASFQHAGFAFDFNSALWAMFSTREGGALYARTSSVGDTLIPGSWLGSTHQYRIAWQTDRIDYFVDGQLVATHNTVLSASMRPVASDYHVGGGGIVLSSLSLTPFQTNGTFDSRIFDAGGPADWNSVVWNADLPAGTTVAISARWGNTPVPDASWTSFAPTGASGSPIGATSRYIQYRASLSTTDAGVSPVLHDVTFLYASVPDLTPPSIASRTPEPNATGVALQSAVTVVFSEALDPDTVTSQSFVLRAAGGATVPVTLSHNGNTVTMTPSELLAGNTSYEVEVDGSVADEAGNPLGADAIWTFATAQGEFVDTTSADFVAGTLTNSSTSSSGDGALQLAASMQDTFDGSQLGTGWTTTSWAPFGGGPTNVQVSGGLLSIAGAQVVSAPLATVAPLSARLAFAAAPYQHFGLATDFASVAGNYWVVFSTGGTAVRLFARSNASGFTQDVDLGALPAGMHDYRIVPVTGGFEFYVDGVLRTSLNVAFPSGAPLRIAASVFLASAMQIDEVRIDAYGGVGEFLSRVFDATRTANWGLAQWNANLPAGTSLVVETRSGNVAAPDGTWSAWQSVTNGGAVASTAARYIQYRVTLSTADALLTPMLFDLTIEWT